MSAIPVTPFLVDSVTFTIATDSYEAAIQSIAFTPSTSSVSVTHVDGSTITMQKAATWTCDLTITQDLSAATSLQRYLHANEGSQATVTVVPFDDGPTISASVTISPTQILDDAGAIASGKVSLGSTKPTIVDPT